MIDVSEEDVLGAVTILETDEEVSSAHIDRYALFDLISRGDEIYFLPEKEDEFRVSAENPPAEQPSSTTIDSELKTQLLRLN